MSAEAPKLTPETYGQRIAARIKSLRAEVTKFADDLKASASPLHELEFSAAVFKNAALLDLMRELDRIVLTDTTERDLRDYLTQRVLGKTQAIGNSSLSTARLARDAEIEAIAQVLDRELTALFR